MDALAKIKLLATVEERNRIAFDLHDGCVQDLASIIKTVELCQKLFKTDPSRALEELDTLRESIREVLNRTRQVIFDLKTPEDADFDLVDNLTGYIRNYRKQNDINIKLDIPGSVNNIPPDKAKSVFYIIAEALTNIRKHSLAKNAELSLETNKNDELTVNIRDDGKGFDVNNALSNAGSSGKWGLISMRERTNSLGGTFAIDSGPQKGTRISINIPLTDGSLKKL